MTGGATNGDPLTLIVYFSALAFALGLLDVGLNNLQRRRRRLIRRTCDCGRVAWFTVASAGFARRCACGRWSRDADAGGGRH